MVRQTANNKDVRVYIQRAKRRVVHAAAARAWACGVGYEEALSIASKAVEAGRAAVAPKGGGKGRGKGRGKVRN